MAQFPALPLWTDAYLADCGHLTDEEHGRYLLLLMLMWRSPECRIPNDDEWIARHLRRDANAMRTHMRPIIDEFCKIEGKWLIQARLRKEWVWCQEKRKKNTEAANQRWGKDLKASKRISKRNAPTPTPIYIKDSNGSLGKNGSDILLHGPEFSEAVDLAKQAYAEKKKYLAPKNLTVLRAMVDGGHITIEEAAYCGWKQ